MHHWTQIVLRELRITTRKNQFPENWKQKTSIMGIINLTPDSFSDGGEFANIESALKQIENFKLSGVDVIDIGAQSTSPGSKEVGPEIELKRLIPVLKEIKRIYPEILLSVDTFHSLVAQEVLFYGANWINDVTGGRRDPKILEVVKDFNCPYVITHSRGNSESMNNFENYNDLIEDIIYSLRFLTDKAISKDIDQKNIIWDPGLGFSKNMSQNINILRNLSKFKDFGFPLLIGASRKRFIGEILNLDRPKDRDIGTLAVSCLCAHYQVEIVRVHNVSLNSQILKVADKFYR